MIFDWLVWGVAKRLFSKDPCLRVIAELDRGFMNLTFNYTGTPALNFFLHNKNKHRN